MPSIFNNPILNALLDFLTTGLTHLNGWEIALVTLVFTHITIVSVTLYLHRSQAHRALDLQPAIAHFFRFWLWMTTGMVTREWVAVHRKHHAKCETEEDPHSPITRGINTVFWQGAELYRAEASNAETIKRYKHGTPDDWIERHLYSRFPLLGVSFMLILDVLLFGAVGLTVWAVQMIWIPLFAAGVINGIGHYWGYRNFESPDTSTNLIPWGILIGGEELHNNHHTYATSAKFKVKPYEFDVGWMYICILEKLQLASIKKVPPKLHLIAAPAVADDKTLEAIITNRYEVMAKYAREMRSTCAQEMQNLKAKGLDSGAIKTARRWLHRDDLRIPLKAQAALKQARTEHPSLDKMAQMRGELQQLWDSRTLSREQLVAHLQTWCQKAEASGIEALRDFSLKLRSMRAA